MSSHPGVMSQVLQNLNRAHFNLDLDTDPDCAPDHDPDLDPRLGLDLDLDHDSDQALDRASDRITDHDLDPDPDLDLGVACHPETSGAVPTALASSAANPPLSNPHATSAVGG